MRRYFILILIFLPLLLSSQLRGASNSHPIPGQFVVKLKKSADAQIIKQSLSNELQLKNLYSTAAVSKLNGTDFLNRTLVIFDSTHTKSIAEIENSIGLGNIEYIEPVYTLDMFALPDDSLFMHQWYLLNTGQAYFGIDRIDGFENDTLALKIGTSGQDVNLLPICNSPPTEATKVVVAIIDTGVDYQHPELIGKIWHNPDEIPNNNIDDDHNGYVDDIIGYDVSGDFPTFFNPIGDNDPSDDIGHGTHIAGIVSAGTNGVGVVGIAQNVEIMPVKINPNASTAVGAAGIIYAVIAGARVINISWGTPFEAGVLRDALNFARQNNVFVAIAAGNSGDNRRFYPAAFDSSFVVAAGNSDGYMTEFSTFGAHIDIVAPGEDILSLRAAGTDLYADAGEPGVRIIGDDSLYYLSDGTSMAAPMIVGAAALLWSIRPDLNLSQMEELITMGARDLVDPFNQGDTLIGPDTLSGYGYLDIASSYELLTDGGLYFIEPTPRNRYTDNFDIAIAPVAGYNGLWRVEYKFQENSSDWQLLGEGNATVNDTIMLEFSSAAASGNLILRLTDKFGTSRSVTVVYVRTKIVEITYPIQNQELKYTSPIIGSVHGADFDSMAVFSRKGTGSFSKLTSSTGEYFDSLLANWSVSGNDTGNFTLYVYGYFDEGLIKDSVKVHVFSAFAEGWPKSFGAFASISPACGDIDGDGKKELIVATSNGLVAFNHDGTIVSGFPALLARDVRCAPALYDIDHDNRLEIICTTKDSIFAINHNGTRVPGWPVSYFTGQIPFDYGFPNPTIAPVGNGADSVVMILNKRGQILAYNFDGAPHFYSLGGLFASFDPRVTDFLSFGGQTSPMVTSFDINRDNLFDIIGSYSSPAYPYEGIGLFESTTGQPAWGKADELVLHTPIVIGTILADLDRDAIPEIISSTVDSGGMPRLWVMKNGTEVMPGWPVEMPAVTGWIGSYPTVGDLDLDGVPEILCTFFEFDVATLYVFKADGTSYLPKPGRPIGEALFEPVTFGTPTVANLVGDDHPEIIIRSGYLLPGTGPERLYIFDHNLEPLPDWPQPTPARPNQTFSTQYAPLVDDIDADGLVELVLLSDANELLVWNFEADSKGGTNSAKFLVDQRNSNIVLPPDIPTDIDDNPAIVLPTTFALEQNYPNPFNPVTSIEFAVPYRSRIQLDVYNILGQNVAVLADREFSAGIHRVNFDASQLSSGIYFYRLVTEDEVLSKKMTLIK